MFRNFVFRVDEADTCSLPNGFLSVYVASLASVNSEHDDVY